MLESRYAALTAVEFRPMPPTVGRAVAQCHAWRGVSR